MNLNELKARVYKCACEHGFHDKELSNQHFLMLVITELSEAVEADRKDKQADEFLFKSLNNKRWFEVAYNRFIKGSVEEELSDVAIRLLDLAGLRNTNVYVYPIELFPNAYRLTEHCYAVCRLLSDSNNIITIEDLEFRINHALSYLFAYAEREGFNLLWHIEQKMKYNELRPLKHGKKY